MNDIMEEANQDYAYQKRVHLFKKALPVVIAATIIAVAVVAAIDWNKKSKLEKQEKRTSLLVDAINIATGQENSRDEILFSLLNEKDGITDVARLELIANAIKSQNRTKALELLENLTNNAYTQVTKNLAKIQYVGFLLDQQKLSQEDINKIQNFLVSIDKTQPLYTNSQIYSALFNIKVGNSASALDIVKKLLEDEKLSESIRSQAESIFSYINEKEDK